MINTHKLEKIESEEFWEIAKDFSEKEANQIVARTNPETCAVMSWMAVRDNYELAREYDKGSLYRRTKLTADEIHEKKVDELAGMFGKIYMDITGRCEVCNDDSDAITTMAEYAINTLGKHND